MDVVDKKVDIFFFFFFIKMSQLPELQTRSDVRREEVERQHRA